MIFISKTLGPLENNVYLVGDEKTKKAVVIDPADGIGQMIDVLKENELTLEAILLTHGHFDHVYGAAALKKWAGEGAKVYLHKKDAAALSDGAKNLSAQFLGQSLTFPPADVLLNDGDVLTFSGLTFQVIPCPGHSAGGVSYLLENLLFSGDTLFCESIGRYDFGSYPDLIGSVRKLLALPEDTKVYPGHGGPTTIGHERRCNPYAGDWSWN